MSEKQLRLDLDDRKQFLREKIENYWLGTDSDWYVFLVRGKLFLGIRTHDLGRLSGEDQPEGGRVASPGGSTVKSRSSRSRTGFTST